MRSRRKLLWAVVMLAAWAAYDRWLAPKGPTYKGRTAAA